MLSHITREKTEADFQESPFFFQMRTSKLKKQTKIFSGMELSIAHITTLIINEGPQNH